MKGREGGVEGGVFGTRGFRGAVYPADCSVFRRLVRMAKMLLALQFGRWLFGAQCDQRWGCRTLSNGIRTNQRGDFVG